MNPRILTFVAIAGLASCISEPPGQDEADAGVDATFDASTADDGRADDAGPADDADASNVDACTPATCAELQACGMPEDGCGGILTCDPCAAPDRILTNVTRITLLDGEEFSQINARVQDTEGNAIPDATLTWSTTDEGIATVDMRGKLTGVGVGSTTLTISSEGVDDATIDVTVENGWSDVAVGQSHTCALTMSGRAYCWGNGFTNAVAARPNEFHAVPQRVDPGNIAHTEIAIGHDHSCAITEDEMEVRCWGSNEWGQVADDPQNSISLNPRTIPISQSGPFHMLAAGLYHTCVLLSDNTPVCWGRNDGGQADYEEQTDVVPPSQVDAMAAFRSLGGGNAVTCGAALNGDLVCWGSDGNGERGDGSETTLPSRTTVRLDDADQPLDAVSLFDGHGCSLVSDGRVVCWGYNNVGQAVPEGEASVPVPTLVFGDQEFVEVSAGARHSCAILASDETKVVCWGSNSESGGDYDITGLLGSDDPMVTTNEIDFGHTVVQLATGWFHSCARLGDGSVRCWGDNDQGQLGNGTMDDSTVPVAVGFP